MHVCSRRSADRIVAWDSPSARSRTCRIHCAFSDNCLQKDDAESRLDCHGDRDRPARSGSHGGVRRLLQRSAADLARSKDQRSGEHAKLLVDLGRLEKLRSNPKQALGHLDQALQLMRSIKGPEDPEVGAILAEMSNIKVWSTILKAPRLRRGGGGESIRSVPELIQIE